jgi:UDP-hydrolysing UDP-N-acetyl-D-glucosamine 2-epimerase
LLVLQHPVTYEREDAGTQMQETMDAIMSLKEQTIIIYPNSDAGGQDMIDVIKTYEKVPFIRTTQNLPYNDFIALLSTATALIGNSSAGIVRTASLGVPCINIGTRQKNREQAGNVIDIGYDSEEIVNAIKQILSDPTIKNTILSRNNPYKNQNTGKKIADVLATTDLSKDLMIKKFHMPRHDHSG